MRKTLIVAAFALLALPGTALAADTTAELAQERCKTEKHEWGTKLFKKTYGDVKSTAKATATCVGTAETAVAAEAKNAAQECKAERDADADAFGEEYGSNQNKKNAFGKCVSAKTAEATAEETEDRVNAAQTCKTMRSTDKAEFEKQYGTTKNAFGKCVSATAKADDEA